MSYENYFNSLKEGEEAMSEAEYNAALSPKKQNKLTVLVQAWNVNGGELNNLAIEADRYNSLDVLQEAKKAYLQAVIDEDEQSDFDPVLQWENDDCQIVGLIDGHPITVTGIGLSDYLLAEFLEHARKGAAINAKDEN